MNEVRIERLTKRFGAITALDQVTLTLPAAGILGVLGPSGCGKTTLLRAIAGLERPDAGSIAIGDRTLFDKRIEIAPERRGIGFVFQDYALFPLLDVAGNVGYGIRDRAHRSMRVRETLELVGLGGLEHRGVGELSGGQQQRVALARALAPSPALILLDEPFSNLDADLRVRVRHEVRAILRAANQTAIFVTHDQAEAFELSDVVAIMRTGRIEQYGPPEEAYHTPATRFVADFVGQAVFLPAEIGSGTLRCGFGSFEVDGLADGPIELMLRPEDIRLGAGDGGTIVWRRFQGPQNLYRVRLHDGHEVLSVASSQTVRHPGESVGVTCEPDHLVIFRDGARLAVVKTRPRTGTDV